MECSHTISYSRPTLIYSYADSNALVHKTGLNSYPRQEIKCHKILISMPLNARS